MSINYFGLAYLAAGASAAGAVLAQDFAQALALWWCFLAPVWCLTAGAVAVVVEVVEAAGVASSAKAGATMKAAETIDKTNDFMNYTPFVFSKETLLVTYTSRPSQGVCEDSVSPTPWHFAALQPDSNPSVGKQ